MYSEQITDFRVRNKMKRNPIVLVISSQVVSGQVGLKAMLPAFRALELETVTLPTTLLAAHPAAFPKHGTPAGGALPASQMLEMVDWLLDAGALQNCAAIVTGYLPSPEHVAAAAQIVQRLKARNPDTIFACDPICGDNGRLYLPQAVVDSLKQSLLPLADIATPNLFELSQLSALSPLNDTRQTIEAARALGVAQVLVTSAPAQEDGRIAILRVQGDAVLRCETARAPKAPHGMGDLFSALYLGLSLKSEPKALGVACATLAQIANRNLEATQLPHGPVNLAPAAIQEKINL